MPQEVIAPPNSALHVTSWGRAHPFVKSPTDINIIVNKCNRHAVEIINRASWWLTEKTGQIDGHWTTYGIGGGRGAVPRDTNPSVTSPAGENQTGIVARLIKPALHRYREDSIESSLILWHSCISLCQYCF